VRSETMSLVLLAVYYKDEQINEYEVSMSCSKLGKR
jgi:hypothetical protein